MRRIAWKFSFLIKSTNQHGVHSPFVYFFLTKGIYNSSHKYKNLSKNSRILQSTLDYFHVENVIGISANRMNNLHTNPRKKKYKKLYYIPDLTYYDEKSFQTLISSVNEDSILYINNPYKSIKTLNNWNNLCRSNLFNVSIDFFVSGLLFKRSEQQKEHFRLRV